MQDVLGPAAEHVEHVLERPEARLVGLCLFRRVDRMERRAEFFDIGHDLRIHGVGQDDQGDFPGDLGQSRRNVRMRTPGRNALIDRFRILVPEGDAVQPAGAFERIVDDVCIRLPVAENLVQPVRGEVPDELLHAQLVELAAVEIARGFRHLEIGQGAVAVEGDVFRPEKSHVRSSSVEACPLLHRNHRPPDSARLIESRLRKADCSVSATRFGTVLHGLP